MSAINFFVRWLHVVTLALLTVAFPYASASSQTPPPATARPQQPATPPRTQAPPRTPAPARTTMVFIRVRNGEGRPVPGVHLVVSGAASRDVMTDFEGLVRLQMADGAYQLRFERDGFVSLEKELTLRNGAPDVVEVTLNAVPPPPPPPPAPEPPPPEPPPPPPPPQVSTPTGAELEAELKTVAVPDFVSKNFIGKETIKESTLGCTPSSTTRLLQVRSSIAVHSHADVDEVLYVVAGEGTLTASNRPASPIGPGSLSVIPRGLSHAVEKRGRNPLILLSMASGAPCETETASASKDK